ncbi:MAG: tRNA pseudouridine(38-40) synthase TruA [Bdellovibrionaceae bacterium]|nr:tRNA pseudouridine(38-40) synthase TruA [Pseudobdellovibrionaceae bacterium]|tara:strand:- start:124253 stop:125035 length:783 start_codon:yes stop_codon:yes gene_type:complete
MSKRYKVKLQLSYDGSDYAGFQKQSNSEPTIQGTLENALSTLLDEPIRVVGCGRTDARVHATKYFIHFWTHKDPSNYNFVYALNGPLTPNSIAFQNAWLAPEEFHALSSEFKVYKYLLFNDTIPNPFKQRYSTYDKRPYSVERLNQISHHLLGEHDFSSFQTSGTESKTTIKTLYQCHWHRENSGHIVFTISGNGFLRQMVRNIVGTALWIDRSGHDPEIVKEILDSRDRQQAKDTAPPQGLYLTHIQYPETLDKRCRKL